MTKEAAKKRSSKELNVHQRFTQGPEAAGAAKNYVKPQEKATRSHGAGPELSQEQRHILIIYGNYSHCLAGHSLS
jgi:hypothetical protein